MSVKRDGGQAYPIPEGEANHRTLGMSLRDSFAEHALMGFCANNCADVKVEDAARVSYEIADAMLDARERPEKIGDAAVKMLASLERIRNLSEPLSGGAESTVSEIWTLADEAIRGAKVAGVKIEAENKGEAGQ